MRTSAALLLAALLLTAFIVGLCLAIAFTTGPADSAALAPYSHCGTERWSIKTLDDPDAAFLHQAQNPQPISVQGLRAVPAPEDFDVHNDSRRYAPIETTVYRVRALLVAWKQETDHDFHIVIADPDDPSKTLVAEVPDPACSSAQAGGHAATFAHVRNAFVTCFGSPSARIAKFPGHMIVDLEGVGFFDLDHGQTGRAKLGDAKVDIELHPILRVHTVSGHCTRRDVLRSSAL